MNPNRASRGGFTLAEVLVATVLLSIVMASVYSLFQTTIAAWRSAEGDSGLHRQARHVLDLLEQEYSNLHAGGSQLFEGADDGFTMYAVAQPVNVTSGEGRRLMRIRYRHDRANATLVREEAIVEGVLPGAVRDATALDETRIRVRNEARFVAARGVREFQVRYLWVARPDPEYWRGPPVPVEPRRADRHQPGWGLPQAIAVSIILEDDRSPEERLSFETVLVTRTLNRQRDAREIARMLESAP
ncbi:MAG: prepilin-type N-terminal cleavage/methylation domain-containing protein [Candidatus Hydrogenedentes bacterium]|nr:prepilin-type N-terminal cleavage/methylation domain-containing protein [Candidatus Hydrogenedentota bacterium]